MITRNSLAAPSNELLVSTPSQNKLRALILAALLSKARGRVLERLIQGYRRFRAEIWPAERTRYEALAKEGQRPETLVVACSDSRVDPQTVFGAGPGELFVVRNVAALVPPYRPDAGYHGTSAALEYGVRVLKVARIVVLGHAQCGGVRAMVEGAPTEARDFVEPWIELGRASGRERA